MTFVSNTIFGAVIAILAGSGAYWLCGRPIDLDTLVSFTVGGVLGSVIIDLISHRSDR